MATSWTNDPVVPGVTQIRAIHITELRNAVNASRSALNLPSYPFSDSSIIPGAVPIRAVHFGEIRSAIQDLWFRKRLGPLPGWTIGSPPSTSRTIRAADMNDLRRWMNAYENSSAGVDPQGVVSFIFDPHTGSPVRSYTIDGDWVDDVTNLKPNGRKLLIRAKIRADEDNAVSPYYSDYEASISTWRDKGYDVALVLTGELYQSSENLCPNASLTGTSLLTNPYILGFAQRCADLAYALRNVCSTYWIWNEPQLAGLVTSGNIAICGPEGEPGTMAPQNFGGLLVTTCQAMRSRVSGLTLCTGSLQIQDNSTSATTYAAWLDTMFSYIRTIGGVAATTHLWDAISLNMEGLFGDSHASDAFNRFTSVQLKYNDYTPLILGEWGSVNKIQINPGPPPVYRNITVSEATTTFQALNRYFPIMYFFQHPALDPGKGSYLSIC